MTSVGGLRLHEAEVRGLGPHAVAALAIGAWHCASNLTDGILTPRAIAGLGIGYPARKKLVEAGLWKERDGGAIEIVDYLEHNPSRADVEARRGKAADRMRRVRGHVRANSIPESPPVRANAPANDTPNERANGGVVPPLDSPSDLSPSGSGSSPDLKSSSVLASDPKDLTGSARDAKPRPKRVTKSPWPEGFPSMDQLPILVRYGLEKGMSRREINDELEAMQLWAQGNGATKLDWMATAKGWLRRSARQQASFRPPGAAQHAEQQKREQEAARRPYHEPFPREAPEPGLAPADALAAIQRAATGIGRAVT